jgi:hypothetical protein
MELPLAPLNTRTQPNGQQQVLCRVRKRWVALTPEEHVRQCLLVWLVQDIGVPTGLLAVERGLHYNGRTKRFDVLAHHRTTGTPALLAECKAPHVPLTNETAYQAALYNAAFAQPGARWLLLTNGPTLWVFEQHAHGYLPSTLPPFNRWA